MIGFWDTDSEAKEAVRYDIVQRLKQYRNKVAEYHACKDLLDQLFPSCTQTLSDMPKIQSDTYEPERWAQRRWEQKERMQDKLSDISKALADTENMIEKLTGVYRSVIIRKYLMGETHESIGIKFAYSERQIRRMHNDAIERLVDNESIQNNGICDSV